jgi:glycosyltransferase involved in cell wall biosynthesis
MNQPDCLTFDTIYVSFMRIAMVAPFFNPVIGGVESYVYNISKELVKRGHAVTVYTANRGKSVNTNLASAEMIEGISVKRFKSLVNIGDASVFPEFIFALTRDDPDIVHLHSLRHPHSVLGGIVGSKLGFNVFLSGHGFSHEKGSVPAYYLPIYRKIGRASCRERV